MSIFQKKHNVFLLLIIAAILFSTQSIVAEESSSHSKTIIVTGTGIIKKNDAAKAREDAISESLVTAVGVVMSDEMPLEIFVPNFQTLNEIIYTHTDNFINGYRVLTETKYKNRYRVLVQARVSRIKVKQQLNEIGIMVGKKKKPKILLLIAEQNLGDILPRYWWLADAPEKENKAETKLSEILKSKGFIITQHIDVSTIPEEEDLIFQTPEPDQKAVAELAKLARADIVIIGRAFAEQTSNTMGDDLWSFKGTLLARAIRISEQQQEIGKTFQSVITVNTDDVAGGFEAISQAASLAGEDLALQITSAYTKKENKASEVKIIVQGTRILSNFVKFRRALSSLNNVGEIRSSEMKADEATIIVEYNGNIQTLAESLMLKSFDSFGINISGVMQDQLRIILVPVDAIPEPVTEDTDFTTEEINN